MGVAWTNEYGKGGGRGRETVEHNGMDQRIGEAEKL